MQITALRRFWFSTQYYTDTDVHKDYLAIQFTDRPNIVAQIWLTIFSPGIAYENGIVGGAAAGFKSFAFINAAGRPEVKELTEWTSGIRVEQIVNLTMTFHVRLAWAKAEGIMYYWE
jgi:hypothetical protein